MEIKEGDTITGFDFGRLRNHIVGAKIRVSKNKQFEFVSFEIIDLGKTTCRNRLQKLVETESPLWESDWFVLESQVPRNITCFVLVHALEVMLLCRGISKHRIFTISSQQKFRVLDKEKAFQPNIKTIHARMKRWSVNLATHMLPNTKSLNSFYSTKKKDDLADAFLSAIAFLWENTECKEITNI